MHNLEFIRHPVLTHEVGDHCRRLLQRERANGDPLGQPVVRDESKHLGERRVLLDQLRIAKRARQEDSRAARGAGQVLQKSQAVRVCPLQIILRGVETNETSELHVSAMFIFIDATARTEIVADLVERDDKGFILTGPDLRRDDKRRLISRRLDRDPYILETSVPGIFAVGDVRAGSGKRVASAVGEGSGCVGMIHRYLETV